MEQSSQIYKLMHFVHAIAAALWIGGAVAADAHMRRMTRTTDAADQHDALKAARRRTISIEMPAVTVLVVAGLAMAAMNTSVFTQAWFHLKLTMVVALVVLFVSTTIRQRQIADKIDPDASTDVRSEVRLHQTLRTVTALAAIGLIFAVTYRMGAPSAAP